MNQIGNDKNHLYSSFDVNKFFTQTQNHSFKFLNDANNSNNTNKNFSMTKSNINAENEKTKKILFLN